MRDRSIALVVRDKKILSVLTRRKGGYINELPGGGIEKGESPEEAAVRELKEECGLDGEIIRQLNVLHWKDGSTEYVFLIAVSDSQKEIVGIDPEIPLGEEQAIKNVRWLGLDEFTERERAFLWAYGLLDVEGFFDIVVGWGSEISYPGTVDRKNTGENVRNDLKTIDIIGDNYFGKWVNTRAACRAVIVKDGKLLLSYETKTGQWMLPGGGLEQGEDEKNCVIRETSEETGIVIEPSDCLLEIDEYYEDWKWINRYFSGTITGTCEQSLTEREKEVGMEPRWIPIEEIIAVFSKHNDYAETDEMRRGMYLREYSALKEILDIKR